MLPCSPLTSMRYVIIAWKSCSPFIDKSLQVSIRYKVQTQLQIRVFKHMVPGSLVILLYLSLEWSHPWTRKAPQTTTLPGHVLKFHVATSLILQWATPGQLTWGLPMAHHTQTHLSSTHPDLVEPSTVETLPIPPHLRLHAINSIPMVAKLKAPHLKTLLYVEYSNIVQHVLWQK